MPGYCSAPTTSLSHISVPKAHQWLFLDWWCFRTFSQVSVSAEPLSLCLKAVDWIQICLFSQLQHRDGLYGAWCGPEWHALCINWSKPLAFIFCPRGKSIISSVRLVSIKLRRCEIFFSPKSKTWRRYQEGVTRWPWTQIHSVFRLGYQRYPSKKAVYL